MLMLRKDLKVFSVGQPSVNSLSESEQKVFYITLLTRILELRKQQLEKEEDNEGKNNENNRS